MSRSEKSIQNDVLLDITKLEGGMFWRNNTGQAWQGQQDHNLGIGDYVKVVPGMVILYKARPINFGLPGSADIIGSYAGRAVAVEMKSDDGSQRKNQGNFERAWVKAGGLYVLARSVDEARNGVLLG